MKKNVDDKALKVNCGKTICFDLDGVILNFDGFKGGDVFGTVIEVEQKTMMQLQTDGWEIHIFTSRLVTTNLIVMLYDNQIPYKDINGRLRDDGTISFQTYYDDNWVDYSPYEKNKYWMHNPEQSSIKPIASVYVDDMNWENEGRNFDEKTWKRLYKSLSRRFGKV